MTNKEFEIKYNIYSKMLYRIIFGFTKNSLLADDILQDLFIKYINLNKTFKSLDEEKYYLIRIAINLCKSNYYNNQKLNKAYLDSYEFNDDIKENESISNLRIKITELPNKYKEVIILHYYDNNDIETISKILKISVSNVKKRLERGRNKLKEMLGDEYEIS